MGITLCMMSRKGGCGKTSLSIHLAGLWAMEGLKVRLVDLDSQASLSQFFLGSEAVENLRPSETVEAVFGGADPEAVERETRFERITLIPAHLKLRVDRMAELNLRSRKADLTIVDTPPDLTNPMIRAALLTADFVVSPVDPEAFGAQSIVSVQQALHSVAIGFNPRLRLLGFVVNKRERLAVHGVVEDTLRRLHGDMIFGTTIPSLTAFKEAVLAGQPVTHYEEDSKAAVIIKTLAAEVFERIEKAADKRAA